jgi:hypothetical protein
LAESVSAYGAKEGYGPKRDEVTGSGEDYIRRSLIRTLHKIIFG